MNTIQSDNSYTNTRVVRNLNAPKLNANYVVATRIFADEIVAEESNLTENMVTHPLVDPNTFVAVPLIQSGTNGFFSFSNVLFGNPQGVWIDMFSISSGANDPLLPIGSTILQFRSLIDLVQIRIYFFTVSNLLGAGPDPMTVEVFDIASGSLIPVGTQSNVPDWTTERDGIIEIELDPPLPAYNPFVIRLATQIGGKGFNNRLYRSRINVTGLGILPP
jgi:hypothetical protein